MNKSKAKVFTPVEGEILLVKNYFEGRSGITKAQVTVKVQRLDNFYRYALVSIVGSRQVEWISFDRLERLPVKGD